MRSSIDGWHCLQIIVPASRLGDIGSHSFFGNEKLIVIILNTVVVYFDHGDICTLLSNTSINQSLHKGG